MQSPSEIELLEAHRPEARARWMEIWSAWPGREVQAHPAYAELFARAGERVVAFACAREGRGLLWPMILRPLDAEPWGIAGAWDATNPYGYGGAYVWGEHPARDVHAFLDGVDATLRQQNVVTAFARLSLFPEQILPCRGAVREVMSNVVRTLDLDGEALLRDYAHKVRKNIARAKSSGLVVEVDEDGAHLDDFIAIYQDTMERREASDSYKFSRVFFETIVRELRGSFAFFHVRDVEGRVVSTELVLLSASHAYSFLGGTRASAFHLRPNDLLKHEIILACRARGLSTFVLGGGYGTEDGIYKYKLAFAPSGARTFRVMQRVYDVAMNEELVVRRSRHDAVLGRVWQPDPNRFPAYRG